MNPSNPAKPIESEATFRCQPTAAPAAVRYAKLVKGAAAALEAFLLTNALSHKLEDAIELAERDVDQVDWINVVLPELDRARDHVEKSFKGISDLVDEIGHELETANDARRKLLLSTLRHLRHADKQHHHLFILVLTVNSRFLEAHGRQKLSRTGKKRAPKNRIPSEFSAGPPPSPKPQPPTGTPNT